MTGPRDPEKRKERIYRAARELFFKKGYRETTMAQIAVHAGYSKRSVYLGHKNKDDLFVSIAADGLSLLLSQLEQLPRGALDVAEYIERYMEIIAVFSCEQPEYFRMFTVDVSAAMLLNASTATQQRAAEIETAGLQLLASEIETAVNKRLMPRTDPWEAAGILIGSVVGIIQLSMGGSQIIFEQKALVEKVKKTSDLICKGLLQD
jgi:AcrR family transcriptional regulator